MMLIFSRKYMGYLKCRLSVCCPGFPVCSQYRSMGKGSVCVVCLLWPGRQSSGTMCSCFIFRDEEFLLFHHLFKYEIFVMKRQSAYGTVGIAVGPVEKLDDPEAAFVYVEMDIPLFKIRCDQAPDFCPGVSPLYLLPDLESEFIYDRNREYVFHVIVKPAVFLFCQVPECNVCHICSFKECRWYPDSSAS